MGFSNRCSYDDAAFVSDIVVKVKELLDHIIIEKPRMHPQEAVMSLLQALNVKKSDLEDLITKPFNHMNGIVSMSTDHLVFLDLNSLINPILLQRVFERVQAGKIHLVLLGSQEDNNEVYFLKTSSALSVFLTKLIGIITL